MWKKATAMRIRTFLAAVALMSPVAVAPVAAWADLIHLHDGTTLSGDIKKAADGWYVTDSSGKTTLITTDRVKSIELTARGEPKDVAVGRLASLRRSVEALTDIKAILARYDQFIDQNKDAPSVVAEARKDQAQWRERLAKGMVKVGSKWVPPEERTQMQEKALGVVAEARDLLKQNKLREADAAVQKALEADPTNVSALYLRGLILYRQDQVQPARKAFEAVKEQMPDHGPALNNLAVVLWRQNQHMPAMAVYLQAMQAMPLNKEVLNNVAEALNALPEEQRKAPVVQKVLRLWQEQDAQLQQQLMPLGWYRWGATWVDKSQFEKLQAAEKEVRDKVAKLEADFADAQQKINTIDGQKQQNQLAIQYMEQSRYATDAQGHQIVYPLPPQYWDYVRANQRLDVQRAETLSLLGTLRAKAQAVRQQLPVPKYTGAQLMIGAEGTPAVVPVEGKKAEPAAATAAPVPGNGKDEGGEGNGAKNPLEAPKAEVKPPQQQQGGGAPAGAPKAPAGERPLKY
jgi:tetratricopeptide (TPR) repeat protein